MFAHLLQDPLGDGKFVPLGPHLCQLLGQLFFEFVQFRTPHGDPFQQLGIHALGRRRPPGLSEREPQSCPLLLGGLPHVFHPRWLSAPSRRR
ncbi:hypothetical protein [Streptomyces mirabilis]|uniref:hypothetical protein n=1 Tax=Streptomyces mirabilis TaxID=68239 RepID=UPI00324F88D4